ncbi:DUF551 domain-containing protein [Citrobacter sp. Cpo074]|uniref:DUF551 domain-containing protein n=1 Tax=Citrobacter sp. Cpo074 TaxID=2985135 RepID=UPI002578D6FF|nr:DUF551 domain-containing protein [Citrobacter sp. Cpo074]MDM2850194.1 DUF551 domain-containing protein [Citrobacter sp. Cpo074]
MTTNNHPAHGPVSLDRLHQISEILSKAAAQSDGGNLGYAMADAVKVINSAIAAFGAAPAQLHLPVQHWEELCRQNPDMSIGDAIIRAAWWNHCAAALQGTEHVSNCDELPLDYLQGHKDGLEWAAQLAEANHPQTGDWLYDDPIELARAIRKGPDMPEFKSVSVDEDDNFYSWFGRFWYENYQKNNYTTSAKQMLGTMAEFAYRAGRESAALAGNSPVAPGCWIPVSERMPERDVDVQVYCADKKEQMVGYMERNETEGWFRFASLPNGGGVYCKPTHWMSLPAAPQQEDN